jgi:hypothetical protein
LLQQHYRKPKILFTQSLAGADREPPYYPAVHEFNPSNRSHARSRSPRLSLFSLDRKEIE